MIERPNGSCAVVRDSYEEGRTEDWADVGGPLATRDQGDVWAWVAATAISGSTTARIYVDIHDPGCHQGHKDSWGVGQGAFFCWGHDH